MRTIETMADEVIIVETLKQQLLDRFSITYCPNIVGVFKGEPHYEEIMSIREQIDHHNVFAKAYLQYRRYVNEPTKLVETKLDLINEARAIKLGIEDLYNHYKKVGWITHEMAAGAPNFACVG